jgi:hypothetical protein
MPDLKSDCWFVMGALGENEEVELPPSAVERLTRMGLVETVDGAPRLTAEGERAYIALESGDDFPGLK